MFGRYVRRGDKQKIAEYFHATPHPAELPLPGEDYNVAPTTFQPIIRQSRELGERELVLAQWGLVPFFTKELSGIKGLSTINARAESTTKASYLARTDEETPPHRARLVVLRMGKSREAAENALQL